MKLLTKTMITSRFLKSQPILQWLKPFDLTTFGLCWPIPTQNFVEDYSGVSCVKG